MLEELLSQFSLSTNISFTEKTEKGEHTKLSRLGLRRTIPYADKERT